MQKTQKIQKRNDIFFKQGVDNIEMKQDCANFWLEYSTPVKSKTEIFKSTCLKTQVGLAECNFMEVMKV